MSKSQGRCWVVVVYTPTSEHIADIVRRFVNCFTSINVYLRTWEVRPGDGLVNMPGDIEFDRYFMCCSGAVEDGALVQVMKALIKERPARASRVVLVGTGSPVASHPLIRATHDDIRRSVLGAKPSARRRT